MTKILNAHEDKVLRMREEYGDRKKSDVGAMESEMLAAREKR